MKCQICLTHFNHSKHKPFVLSPCTHICCLNCLNDLTQIMSPSDSLCPVCELPIKNMEPSWALLNRISNEQETERIKQQLIGSIDHLEQLKIKLNNLNKKAYKENLLNLKDMKQEIASRSDQLLRLVQVCQNKMIKDAQLIETNYALERLNHMRTDHHIDYRIKEARQLLAKNELNKEQLECLKEFFREKCTQVNSKIKAKKQTKTLYDLVPAETIHTTEFLIGLSKSYQKSSNDMNEKDYHAQGKRYLDEKKYLEAIQCFENALEMNSMCSACYNYKGLALLGLNKYAEAVFCFDRSIELDSNNFQVSRNKEKALNQLKINNSGDKRF